MVSVVCYYHLTTASLSTYPFRPQKKDQQQKTIFARYLTFQNPYSRKEQYIFARLMKPNIPHTPIKTRISANYLIQQKNYSCRCKAGAYCVLRTKSRKNGSNFPPRLNDLGPSFVRSRAKLAKYSNLSCEKKRLWLRRFAIGSFLSRTHLQVTSAINTMFSSLIASSKFMC